MKFMIVSLFTLFSVAASAQNRTQICHKAYQHDLFTENLALTLVRETTGTLSLRMDTPTPYGIRTFSYEVQNLSCDAGKNLHVEAKSSGTDQGLAFESQNQNQAGQLSYVDASGAVQSTLTLECAPAEIQKFCP